MMTPELIVVVAPTTEPVSLAEVKEQCRIEPDFTLDDTLLGVYISAARDRVEKYCNRFFTVQTVKVAFNTSFPSGNLDLFYPDLTAVTALTYTDSNGASQTVDGADYVVDLDGRRLIPVGGWPSDAISYQITVTTSPPVEFQGAKIAMLMMVADMYDLRTENVLGISINDNPAVKAAAYPYRWELGI